MQIALDSITVASGSSTSTPSTIGLVPVNANMARYYSGRYGLVSSDYFGNRIVSVKMRMSIGNITAAIMFSTSVSSLVGLVPKCK